MMTKRPFLAREIVARLGDGRMFVRTFSVSTTAVPSKQQAPGTSALLPLRGVFPVLVTPFHNDKEETIDLESFRRCISFMKNDVGCQGVTIAGVLGESNRLTDFEKIILIETAVDQKLQSNRNLDFQLCVGVSHAGTAATSSLCQMAYELGADAVMVSPTKDSALGPQPSNDTIFGLYETIADKCPNINIVLQDLPSLSGVHLSIDLMARILSEIPQVTTIKLESLPTTVRIHDLCTSDYAPPRDSYSILTGLGALYAGFDLLQGQHSESGNVRTDGFMTGFAFPEILMAMVDFERQQQYDKICQVYEKYLSLIVLEQKPGEGLAIRKEIYKRRGLISSSHVRHPGKNLSMALQKTIQWQLERLFPSNTINVEQLISTKAILASQM
jgi:4-hydroxy-tetrahydrodipicolinate synthase